MRHLKDKDVPQGCGSYWFRIASRCKIGYLQAMIVQVNLPDDLVAKIDEVAADRTAFVSEAVRRLLHDGSENPMENETARINELADELNREALDVLEYQVIS